MPRHRQTDRQTDRQTGRQAGRQTDGRTRPYTVCPVEENFADKYQPDHVCHQSHR